MNKKIVYMGIISIILLIGLEAGATGKITKDSNCSWIVITTPENGDLVNMPLTIESVASSDTDIVEYGFYADWNGNGNYYWQGSVHWRAFEPPYTFTVDFDLEHGSTLTIRANALKYGPTGNLYSIANAEHVTVTIEESWIEITTPENGANITMPLTIESVASSDTDIVEYGFYADWNGNGNYYWQGSVHWRAFEPPYTFTVDFDLEHGSTLTIRANALKYGPTGNLYSIANAEHVTVTIVKPSLTNR